MTKKKTSLGYNLESPLETVIEKLKIFKDNLDEAEEDALNDIAYILQIIQSGNLYQI